MDLIEDTPIEIFIGMKQKLNDINIILDEFKNDISLLKQKSYKLNYEHNEKINNFHKEYRISFTIDEKLNDLKNLIDDKLRHICEHEWVTDYIDDGPFHMGIKIKYCCKCELNEK
jgi:hypothetical protein